MNANELCVVGVNKCDYYTNNYNHSKHTLVVITTRFIYFLFVGFLFLFSLVFTFLLLFFHSFMVSGQFTVVFLFLNKKLFLLIFLPFFFCYIFFFCLFLLFIYIFVLIIQHLPPDCITSGRWINSASLPVCTVSTQQNN